MARWCPRRSSCARGWGWWRRGRAAAHRCNVRRWSKHSSAADGRSAARGGGWILGSGRTLPPRHRRQRIAFGIYHRLAPPRSPQTNGSWPGVSAAGSMRRCRAAASAQARSFPPCFTASPWRVTSACRSRYQGRSADTGNDGPAPPSPGLFMKPPCSLSACGMRLASVDAAAGITGHACPFGGGGPLPEMRPATRGARTP